MASRGRSDAVLPVRCMRADGDVPRRMLLADEEYASWSCECKGVGKVG